MFLPVLENASKAQKLRSTLGVFERSKFFFNLPGSLMESIEAVSSQSPILGIKISDRISCRENMRQRCGTTRKANSYSILALSNYCLLLGQI